MAQIIQTADLKERITDDSLRNQVYCGLDSCVTLEVQQETAPLLDPNSQLIYNFSRALQAPVLEMMLRGILTDDLEVSKLISTYEGRRTKLYHIINAYARVIWGKALNPLSPKQLAEIFYETMDIPPFHIFDKGKRRISTNREAMEHIQQYRFARPLSKAVLSLREIAKKIAVLKSGIDHDGKMRFSWNIGGTNTGRFSSNRNVFGGGTNGQNITDELRKIFIPAPGRKFAYLDLEQAESRSIAYDSGDEAYIEACEASDLHTFVAMLIWPELSWGPPSAAGRNKAVAKKAFWRHWSYRDLSKRGGHLTNYLGQPKSNAKALHIAESVMAHFQRTYLTKFSGISRYHMDVARELQITSTLTTSLGRKRIFFGRTAADDVLRKGVAYRPQSTVGDLLNLGMWRVWKHLPECDILAQLHDAILIEYDDDPAVEANVIRRACELMTIPVMVTDSNKKNPKTRQMVIPVEAMVGWNWAKSGKDNPGGLVVYGEDSDRQRPRQDDSVLSRLLKKCG